MLGKGDVGRNKRSVSGARLNIEVRLRRLNLNAGLAPQARYFSLRGQRKVSKRKAARLPLYPCAPRFRPGSPEGASMPICRRAESIPRPSWAIPAESSGARRGKREKNSSRVFSISPVWRPRASEPWIGIAQRGTRGIACGDRGPGTALLSSPVRGETRRNQGAIRVAFSFVPFFWPNKRKGPACGAAPAPN